MANNTKTFEFKAPATKTNGDWERALGFINLMVANSSGQTSKFGAINLLASNANQKALFDGLVADTTGKLLNAVLDNLALDFNPGGSSVAWDFLEDDAETVEADPTKALGYINFFLPDEDGEMVQLGKVSLWAKTPREQKLFNALVESEERCTRTLKAILASLRLTFHPNTPGAAKKPGFALLKAA